MPVDIHDSESKTLSNLTCNAKECLHYQTTAASIFCPSLGSMHLTDFFLFLNWSFSMLMGEGRMGINIPSLQVNKGRYSEAEGRWVCGQPGSTILKTAFSPLHKLTSNTHGKCHTKYILLFDESQGFGEERRNKVSFFWVMWLSFRGQMDFSVDGGTYND